MPPIHWLRLRQSSTPCVRLSTSVAMVAPVVVKPDIVSNQQSEKVGNAPLSQYGNTPKMEYTIHTSATMAYPSRSATLRSARLPISSPSKPVSRVIAVLTSQASKSGSWYANAVNIGANMNNASRHNSAPSVFTTIFLLNVRVMFIFDY